MSLVSSLSGTEVALPLILGLYACLLVVHAWLEDARTDHAPYDDMVGAAGIALVALVGLLARDLQPVLAVLVTWAAGLVLYELGWRWWRHRVGVPQPGR